MGFYVVDKPVERDVSREFSYEQVWQELVLDKTYTAKDRVIVCDSDMIAYRVASACDNRSILVSRGGKTKEFKTRTEFKKYCADKSLDYNTFTIEDKIVAEPIENCLSTIKRIINNIKEQHNINHVVHILSGGGNHRLDLPLPTKYKSNRKDTIKPTHLQACKDYLIKYHNAYVISGYEADDIVQSLTEYIINNTKAYGIAFSIDKDYHTSLKKNRYLNPITDKIVELGGGLGKLERTDKGVKGDGLFWICYQLMMGDPSDGYNMKYFYNKKYGEVSFYNDMKDCTSEYELLTKVVLKIKELIGDSVEYTAWNGNEMSLSWLELAELYFSCLYMRGYQDNTTFKSLLDKYEADIND